MLYHLEDIDTIRKYENDMRLLGYNVYDLSYWDCGDDYSRELLSILNFEDNKQPFKYIYSYEIEPEIHDLVKKRIAKTQEDESCLFFSNSTTTIVNVSNFLQKCELVESVCVIQPSYFTVEPTLSSFGINVHSISLNFRNRKFHIPLHEIIKTGYDAVWVTSPIFCTSTYFDDKEIYKIQTLLDNGVFVIIDESLCIEGRSIRNKLHRTENLLTLHSPHKVISVNAIKFSALICNMKYEYFFHNWSDLFAGGLAKSSRMAIDHFLSDNYLECLKVHISYTNRIKKEVCKILLCDDNSIFFSHEIGQYITIYMPKVPYQESTKGDFIKDIIYDTKISLLPGYLEGFFDEFGFCFRVNLTLNKNDLIYGIKKVICYIQEKYV